MVNEASLTKRDLTFNGMVAFLLDSLYLLSK